MQRVHTTSMRAAETDSTNPLPFPGASKQPPPSLPPYLSLMAHLLGHLPSWPFRALIAIVLHLIR